MTLDALLWEVVRLNNLRILIHHFVGVFRFMVCWLLFVVSVVFTIGVVSAVIGGLLL